jgi:hypothetical protein
MFAYCTQNRTLSFDADVPEQENGSTSNAARSWHSNRLALLKANRRALRDCSSATAIGQSPNRSRNCPTQASRDSRVRHLTSVPPLYTRRLHGPVVLLIGPIDGNESRTSGLGDGCCGVVLECKTQIPTVPFCDSVNMLWSCHRNEAKRIDRICRHGISVESKYLPRAGLGDCDGNKMYPFP